MTELDTEDKIAFVSLITSHSGIIHKICRLYRDRIEDREDLFQEITFQLWKSYSKFKGNAKISTWLYRIALNTAINTFRKKQPNVNYTVNLPDVADELPDEELLAKQQQLFAALKLLNDAEKAIITLYLEDMSYQQIAEITGITDNYVGVKINRIKTKIQSIITRL
ncbi:MAG: sigma-70 family RNA polymerase sigma factor [Pedobacter sp.]|nr:MAG: sigma-70 family RNA polymerase sigma factor [Pedobacter sp.]